MKIPSALALLKGQIAPGNINLRNRPQVRNNDGSISTVRSISIEKDGQHILIPTVVGGFVVSNRQAIDHYRRTGRHLGIFDSERSAKRAALALHEQQAKLIQPPRGPAPPRMVRPPR